MSANKVQDLQIKMFSLHFIQYQLKRWSWIQNFVDSAVYYAQSWTKSDSCYICKGCAALAQEEKEIFVMICCTSKYTQGTDMPNKKLLVLSFLPYLSSFLNWFVERCVRFLHLVLGQVQVGDSVKETNFKNLQKWKKASKSSCVTAKILITHDHMCIYWYWSQVKNLKTNTNMLLNKV